MHRRIYTKDAKEIGQGAGSPTTAWATAVQAPAEHMTRHVHKDVTGFTRRLLDREHGAVPGPPRALIPYILGSIAGLSVVVTIFFASDTDGMFFHPYEGDIL
jgi:hypothetical protein